MSFSTFFLIFLTALFALVLLWFGVWLIRSVKMQDSQAEISSTLGTTTRSISALGFPDSASSFAKQEPSPEHTISTEKFEEEDLGDVGIMETETIVIADVEQVSPPKGKGK